MQEKKNVMKISPRIREELRALPREIIAGCAKIYTASALKAGVLAHLGVKLTDAGLETSADGAVVPPANRGKYSEQNASGYIVVRNDLPMEEHYTYVDAPNFGDPYKGTHTVALPYQKYPREEFPPRLTTISIKCRHPEPGRENYGLIFEVNEPLDKLTPDFEERLLTGLNLLQENIGHCGVQRAGATVRDYQDSLHVTWDILPPGTKEEAIERLFAGKKPSPEQKKSAEDRYQFLMTLKPRKLVFGRSGFNRYFGALLRDDLVVFENIEYGNAVYIMYENWPLLSQKTRLELMAGIPGRDFERVVHRTGWKTQVKEIIKERLSEAR